MGIIGDLLTRGARAEMDLKTDKEKYMLGETVECTVSVTPKSNFNARQARVELQSVERVTTSTGGRTDTEISNIYTKKEVVQSNPHYSIGQMITNKVKFEIPSDAKSTYEGKKAFHRWYVRFIIDIPLGIDLKSEKEITVR